MTAREALLAALASRVPRRPDGSTVRVAVDGIDGVGKTVFADALADALRSGGRAVLRASADNFHRPRAQRYRRGPNSPVGFFLDSFDYPRLHRDLLDPFGPGGSGCYRLAAHDVVTDRYLDEPIGKAPAGAVLILDGLFLHRDELRSQWDFSVFLDAPFRVTAARMAVRDGTNADPDHISMRRYVDGQRLYLETCDPIRRATVVVDNTDWNQPAVVSLG